ncbi:MAG TPA: protein kinase [Polyangiaceae bacterium]|nr:protein kinase [Polyangiaceae bacterium]
MSNMRTDDMRRPGRNERNERFQIAAVPESGFLRRSGRASSGDEQDLDEDPTRIHAPRALGALPSSLPPPPPLPRFEGAPDSRRIATDLGAGALISDQYVVERVVGNMGPCVLVKVRHARLGQRFHLKYLRAEGCKTPEAVGRFLNGARAAMNLRSEHAARTVDAGRLPSGAPYIVFEAFQGSELRELLRVRGALTPTEAVDFVLQAAEAVAEAHRQGLTHGGLSPSTLFVTRRSDGLPIIKVLEFGDAETLRANPLGVKIRSWNHGTAAFWESTRLWDTLAYSAPEQLRMAQATPLSDVWALGATLHELLSGSPPFHAESASSLLAAIVADTPAPLTALCNGLPRGLEAIVLRCLSKEAHARFPSVADLAAALREFASPEAQLGVDRIARIQSFDPQHAPLSAGPSRAIVRVGPSPVPSSPSSAATLPTPGPPSTAAPPAQTFATRSLGLALLGSALLAALGVLGGTLAGAAVARSALGPQTHAPAPLVQSPATAKPKAADVAPAPVAAAPVQPSPLPATSTAIAPPTPTAPRRPSSRPTPRPTAAAPRTTTEPHSKASTPTPASTGPAARSTPGLFDQMD